MRSVYSALRWDKTWLSEELTRENSRELRRIAEESSRMNRGFIGDTQNEGEGKGLPVSLPAYTAS